MAYESLGLTPGLGEIQAGIVGHTNRPGRWHGTPNDEKPGYFQSKAELVNPGSQSGTP
jgi:hypothetical protein